MSSLKRSARPDPRRALPPVGRPVPAGFFDRDAQEVAAGLLGLVLCHRVGGRWLMASLVEVEAYYLEDRASHASLGFTPKRRALFMPPGTIYMYYARGGDSFNVSVRGAGNAVLLKAGLPLLPEHLLPEHPPATRARRWSPGEAAAMLAHMQRLNPVPSGHAERGPRAEPRGTEEPHQARQSSTAEPHQARQSSRAARPVHRLCAGQTLLCRALGLKVPAWDARPLPSPGLMLVDVGYRPPQIVRARRLGIPPHRDPHLLYRYVDVARAQAATRHPIGRGAQEGVAYERLPATRAR